LNINKNNKNKIVPFSMKEKDGK